MYFIPNWPAPRHVQSLCTTRQGGVSQPPFDGFNLASHVGDDIQHVLTNRQRLLTTAQLPSEPFWLDQQHTTRAIQLKIPHHSNELDKKPPYLDAHPRSLEVADASWTEHAGLVSVVMTADCLPLLITNRSGTLVAAIHAGWKGLAEGIVTQTIKAFPKTEQNRPDQLIVWVGPAISVNYFEVGEGVRQAFLSKSDLNDVYFHVIEATKHSKEIKYLADLSGLVAFELNGLGVMNITQSELCSYSQSDAFYSYRRSGKTGRMASLIWLAP